MRVFYDHQVTSLQNAGGVSRYFYELAHALVQTGQVDPDFLLGFENSVIPFRQLPSPARIIAAHTSMKPGYQRYALNEAWSAAMSPLLGRYEIYHATYQRLLPYVRRKAVVVTHHDSTPDRFPALFPDVASIHARLSKVYADADRIICISESSRQDLLHYYNVAAEKTTVIHHGFSPLPASGRKKFFDGRRFLLYVGARSTYKNFPLVLKALAQQPDDLCLLVIGGGAPSADESALIDQLQLGHRIQIIPRASDAELAAAYQAATIFVYPSLYEGFGFPPLEAMHAGCPAVVSRTSALPEICGDAAFYFNPESIDDLAQLLQTLLMDENLRSSKKDAGLAQVRRYTWTQAAAATLAVYREVLAAK